MANFGFHDDVEWTKHHATQGNLQPHEHIGYTGIAIQGADGKRCSPPVSKNVCYQNMRGGIGSMQRSRAIIEANVCVKTSMPGFVTKMPVH